MRGCLSQSDTSCGRRLNLTSYSQCWLTLTVDTNNITIYSPSDLHQLLYDLFNTGSDTVTNMLRWVTYYMARHPDIAARCQEEIDAVLPPGELVTLEHKQRSD